MGLIFLGIIMTYGLIFVRLVIVQIVQHHFYEALGDRQYMTTLVHTPPRAVIYDRNGVVLAHNRTYASACLFPNKLENKKATYAFLEHHFPRAAERLRHNEHLAFLYVQRHLTGEQERLIRESELNDLYIIDEPGRYYPVACLGPLIGITTIDQEGAFGLELHYDTHLRGTPTSYTLQRDARNSHRCYFAKTVEAPGAHGTPLHTTIDSTLQFLAYEELVATLKKFNASEGAVIIMNPQNGDIVAMASYPDFDPNNTTQLDMATTKNRCITETYEFGSVIKVFLALAALDEGIVTPETLINCYNTKEIILNGMKLSTWRAHGIIPFAEVISGSNNIGTAQVARQLGEKIYEHYRRCGFGTATGLLSGEQAGHVTHPSTWSLQSYASLSYGYEIRATLLQLACAWCLFARRGTTITPRIVQQNTSKVGVRKYREEVIDQLVAILEQTVQHGTAKRAHIKGYTIYGKTGSANLCVDGHYSNEKSLYTFAGVVEKGDYQRIIATYVKEAKGYKIFASTVTAPLFEAIAERMLVHDGILR